MESPKKPGCGLFHTVFRHGSMRSRRSASESSLQPPNLNDKNKGERKQPEPRARPGSKSPSAYNHQKSPSAYNHQKSPSAYNHPPLGKVPQTRPGISGELEIAMADYQRSKGPGNLLRASSGNVMLHANLGNLRLPVNNANNNGNYGSSNYATSVMGNVVRKNDGPEKPVSSISQALSTRTDPEELKILGNEDYKNGRFSEALAFYDAAISVDPNKASYRSNKSAALVALGRLMEAVIECREAIRIDPFYQRAHNRLATIYIRLGEAEKAMYHFKQSGSEADPDSINQAKKIQLCLNKCTEAKRQRDWNTIEKEAGLCIEAGANSAPLVFGLRAEALLRLNRQEEAIETMEQGPNFDVDSCVKIFGPIGSSSLLVIRAQVELVMGRFGDALAAVQQASRLDPSNKEVDLVMRRTKAVLNARTTGNEMFKEKRYSEAIVVYGEGLSSDPCNAILLCNRAACRSKLGEYEKAIEDCSAALKARSSYSKARLRRADCYAKMRKWEECVKDCEVLIRENPEDGEMMRMMEAAKIELLRR